MSLLAAAAAAFSFFNGTSHPTFSQWVSAQNRTYSSPAEVNYRRSIYERNLERIEAHNAAGHSWTMGVNKFADLTADEFRQRQISGGFHARPSANRSTTGRLGRTRASALPTSVDWTTKGAVTPVKNQEQCGSCWSFSTTGSVEGAWFLSNGTLVSLSEQQLVDCSTAEGNQGCNGGLMDYAFEQIIKNKGITTEAAYPQTATGPNKCKAAGKPIAATLSSYTDVTPNSDTALMTAVAQQPVSVAVEADQSSFQFYTSGVMTAACGTNLDHGVLVVGYGTEGGQDYYKVKNSWGADWGLQGYILLGRGSSQNGGSGQCGILMQPSYPVV